MLAKRFPFVCCSSSLEFPSVRKAIFLFSSEKVWPAPHFRSMENKWRIFAKEKNLTALKFCYCLLKISDFALKRISGNEHFKHLFLHSACQCALSNIGWHKRNLIQRLKNKFSSFRGHNTARSHKRWKSKVFFCF